MIRDKLATLTLPEKRFPLAAAEQSRAADGALLFKVEVEKEEEGVEKACGAAGS